MGFFLRFLGSARAMADGSTVNYLLMEKKKIKKNFKKPIGI